MTCILQQALKDLVNIEIYLLADAGVELGAGRLCSHNRAGSASAASLARPGYRQGSACKNVLAKCLLHREIYWDRLCNN